MTDGNMAKRAAEIMDSQYGADWREREMLRRAEWRAAWALAEAEMRHNSSAASKVVLLLCPFCGQAPRLNLTSVECRCGALLRSADAAVAWNCRVWATALTEARWYVNDALEAHEHSDGRDLLARIDALLGAEGAGPSGGSEAVQLGTAKTVLRDDPPPSKNGPAVTGEGEGSIRQSSELGPQADLSRDASAEPSGAESVDAFVKRTHRCGNCMWWTLAPDADMGICDAYKPHEDPINFIPGMGLHDRKGRWLTTFDSFCDMQTPIPAPGPPCPKCGAPTAQGFGLAGGGYGAYEYCDTPGCGHFEKFEEFPEDWE